MADASGRCLEPALLRLDAVCRGLSQGRDRISLPLARAARAFAHRKAWVSLGYMRPEDHARERLGRTARWLRELAALGDALVGLPSLGEALTGADGGRPIGRVAAGGIGRVASAGTVTEWVRLARRVPVRALQEALREARRAGSSRPPASGAAAPEAGRDPAHHPPGTRTSSPRSPGWLDPEADDDADRWCVSLETPWAVRAAFDEGRELHRAVEGREASTASFVEALAAETFAEGIPVGSSLQARRHGPGRAAREEALEVGADGWRHLPGEPPDPEPAAAAALARLRDLSERAGRGGAREVEAQLRELVSLEDEIERRLGEVLARMARVRGWSRLRFSGAGHYGQERLGLSRRAAEDRVRLARVLAFRPALRASYEAGRIGAESAMIVARILGPGADAATERAWVRRAEEATVKRLRDEARLVRRDGPRAPGKVRPVPPPFDDAAWHGSLRRGVGTATERIRDLGSKAVEHLVCDGSLRIDLPVELAEMFLGTVEASRSILEERAEAERPAGVDLDRAAPASAQVARTFSARGLPVPAWAGLLRMLEQYAGEWDRAEAGRGRPKNSIYARDGFRCTAPGCTSRCHMEDHHVDYKSQGGSNEPSNRTLLCRGHHQRGEHGGLASVVGLAPLGLTWRLGRDDPGVEWFRNEIRIARPGFFPRKAWLEDRAEK